MGDLFPAFSFLLFACQLNYLYPLISCLWGNLFRPPSLREKGNFLAVMAVKFAVDQEKYFR